MPIKRTVIGKNQFWLNVGSISLTLAFAIHCFCQGTLPLCLNVKLKWASFSLQGDFLTLSTCGWSAEKKTLINTLLFCKINGLLTLLPHLLSFFFQKKKNKKGTQTPIIWLFWDISLPSSQSANFPNKVAIPCLNTSSVSLTGLLWSEESELELSNSNTAICGSLFMTSHTRNKVHHKLSITNFTFEIKDREEFNLTYH